MPSKKPQFVIRAEQEILDKIAYIASENERSSTQEIVYLIKQRIKSYEQEHGEIQIEEKSNKENAIIKGLKIVSGVAVGEAAADIVIKKQKKSNINSFKTHQNEREAVLKA